MEDLLVWRAGDGPLADWLERVLELLAGPQPEGYLVRGDVHWPDQPYGRNLHHGLDVPGLAEALTAEGVDALCAITHRGHTPDTGRVSIEPLVWRAPGPQTGTIPVAEAVPLGTPAGRVRLSAEVRSLADLGTWLGRLSPLLPTALPDPEWSAAPLRVPLAAAYLHRRDDVMVCVDTLESREGIGNPTRQVLLRCDIARLSDDVRLLGERAVVETRHMETVDDMASWLNRLAETWRSPPLPKPGRWAGATALPPMSRGQVWSVEDGAPHLLVERKGPRSVFVHGPAAELARWAAPLLEPFVHEDVPASSRRHLARWLRRVEHTLFQGPAIWSVTGVDEPLDSADLAAWLHAHSPDSRMGVGNIADGTAELLGARTSRGGLTVTGRHHATP
ncbi:hypothetical protein [Streptomyces spongiae]|uniref:Uncharacterized protein n=1 Tax=Streptomyces spongiae TaxID=565072 RepID=A0A5N8XPV3_9ACTN|nr:hypothetical protein [Streptomyces spongiae]MPY60605.1 hypothetical protein [Streptomyces spongiae]